MAAGALTLAVADGAAPAGAGEVKSIEYEGRLLDKGLPVNALVNLEFGVFDAVIGGAQIGPALFAEDVPVRVVLMADGQEVGHTGMAHGAEFDRASGVLNVKGNTEASIGLMLAQEGCESIRIVVLDPKTDAVLATTDEIPVKLGI